MQILLVEDDADLLRLMVRMLRMWGCDSVFSAMTGEEALAILESSHPNLIITDLHVPNINGMTLAKVLRERGETTPILMITADDDWYVDERARSAGVDRILKKPIDANQLRELVAEMATH
ncbi:MAG: response regulator [Tepidisphaeraceae bacterium]|jgi:CheY-like chemotaxis protein